jgi:endonuclease/exonuclease/phosphatase family metal-dependent hydrolase
MPVMTHHTILLVIAFLLIFIGGTIFYAASPGYSSKEFPSEGIKQFDEYIARTHSSIPNEITAIAYNIGYASAEKNNQPVELNREEVIRNLDSMVSALKELDPDIVFLQEVDFGAARTFNINQMEYLARGLEMPYAAYVITWNKRYVAWPYWPPKRHFGKMLSGQAILSRFPIESESSIRFDKPEENQFWYNWFYLDRIAQRISLKVGEQTWSAWNIHLEAYHQNTRHKQIEKLRDAVQKDPQAVLAAGDYNEKPGSELNKFSEETGMGKTGLEIDHIFYSNKFKLEDSGHLSITASDHFPIWARFKKTAREGAIGFTR